MLGREHGDHLVLGERHGVASSSGERDHGDLGSTLFEPLVALVEAARSRALAGAPAGRVSSAAP